MKFRPTNLGSSAFLMRANAVRRSLCRKSLARDDAPSRAALPESGAKGRGLGLRPSASNIGSMTNSPVRVGVMAVIRAAVANDDRLVSR